MTYYLSGFDKQAFREAASARTRRPMPAGRQESGGGSAAALSVQSGSALPDVDLAAVRAELGRQGVRYR